MYFKGRHFYYFFYLLVNKYQIFTKRFITTRPKTFGNLLKILLCKLQINPNVVIQSEVKSKTFITLKKKVF